MQKVKTISTLKCQICGQHGLIPVNPPRGSRRVVVCQNEYVTHFRVSGSDYLARNQPIEFAEIASLN